MVPYVASYVRSYAYGRQTKHNHMQAGNTCVIEIECVNIIEYHDIILGSYSEAWKPDQPDWWLPPWF